MRNTTAQASEKSNYSSNIILYAKHILLKYGRVPSGNRYAGSAASFGLLSSLLPNLLSSSFDGSLALPDRLWDRRSILLDPAKAHPTRRRYEISRPSLDLLSSAPLLSSLRGQEPGLEDRRGILLFFHFSASP